LRYLVSGKEMKLLDQNTSQVFHVPELVLMEQASMAFVQKLLVLKQNKLSTALIACGSGNNGGDGLKIFRYRKCYRFPRFSVIRLREYRLLSH
jgi:ADP-dependent NAD(P)H-hydrate dehydratase / NAD(P)H-hydrate epimerase